MKLFALILQVRRRDSFNKLSQFKRVIITALRKAGISFRENSNRIGRNASTLPLVWNEQSKISNIIVVLVLDELLQRVPQEPVTTTEQQLSLRPVYSMILLAGLNLFTASHLTIVSKNMEVRLLYYSRVYTCIHFYYLLYIFLLFIIP